MRVLVTGGSGFIGSALVQELEGRADVRIEIWDTRKPEFETAAAFKLADVTSPNLPDASGFDVIYHCAAILGAATTFQRIGRTFSVNVGGTLNVLSKAGGRPVIVKPGLLGDWLNPYMISAKTAEKCGLMYREYLRAKFVSCRLTVIYDPGQVHGILQKKAVPVFIQSALKNQPLAIYGDGSYKVRLLYVRDAARLLVRAAESYAVIPPCIQATSVWAENYLTVRELAERVISLAQSNSRLDFRPMRIGQPAEALDAGADLGQTVDLFNHLGFTEETFLDEGLTNTIAWHRKRGSGLA